MPSRVRSVMMCVSCIHSRGQRERVRTDVFCFCFSANLFAPGRDWPPLQHQCPRSVCMHTRQTRQHAMRRIAQHKRDACAVRAPVVCRRAGFINKLGGAAQKHCAVHSIAMCTRARHTHAHCMVRACSAYYARSRANREHTRARARARVE